MRSFAAGQARCETRRWKEKSGVREAFFLFLFCFFRSFRFLVLAATERERELRIGLSLSSFSLSFLSPHPLSLTLNESVMGSELIASDVSVTARVGDFHSGEGAGDRAAAAASTESGAAVAMPLDACAASLPGTCF
jgi:hypothetical protein